MRKLTHEDPETKSADITSENIEALRDLFPEAFTEGKIDFEVLRQLLGDAVDEREEKFGLNWHGKRQARQFALTPSTGTLRPCPEGSVDWDTTQNLMIEGDNLEVLKLLQKSYAGKVKLIYIDPPYNTGNDFIYPDDYRDNMRNYLELTQQVDETGHRLTTNSETSGRFHTDWLNMIYPRLRLARALLRDDGAIFVTIDDNEVYNLRSLMNEIFGAENFIATIVWQKKQSPQNDAINLSDMHDYLVVYARQSKASRGDEIGWQRNLLPRGEAQDQRYTNPDADPRGDWTSVDYTCNKSADQRPNLYYPLVRPCNGEEVWPSRQRVWRYEPGTHQQNVDEERLWWGDDGMGFPRLKRFRSEVADGIVPTTWWDREFAGDNQAARRELRRLFSEGEDIFDTPKPVRLIHRMLQIATQPNSQDIVMDFFAGSCTTAQAVLEANEADGGNRRFLMVQLPEPTGNSTLSTLSQLGIERVRRVIAQLGQGLPRDTVEDAVRRADHGFRAFRLDSTSIREWDPDPEKLDQTVMDSVRHLRDDRDEDDILYELLLKLGLDLCVPIEERTIAGKQVHSIGAGVLFACLAEEIGAEEVEPLAQGIVQWHQELAPAGETTCVFRDDAFEDDVAKTNLSAIPEQHEMTNVRSL